MPSFHLIVISVLAFLGLSCARMPEAVSGARSLDELALGRDAEGKACAGLSAATAFKDRVEYDAGVDSGRLEPALAQALTAVPLPVRQLYRAVGGRIRVTPEAGALCASPSASGGSASSCFKVGGKVGGQQNDVTIVLAADEAVLASRTVRAFGYVVSQYFGRLYKKGAGLDLRFGLNSTFAKSQAQVGAAFLSDLNLAPNAARAAELSSRAYAEAFDSWYCQAGGPEEMKARFPKTHDAFAEVNAYVQRELGAALKRFAKPASLALADEAAAGEKINGDLSQAATTEITATTSSASDPLISGTKTEEKTFTDPAPTTPPATGDKPSAGPNDVVVTINPDGTVAGAGTDNIANDGQLVIIDNRDKPSTTADTKPADATTATADTKPADTTTATTDTKPADTTTATTDTKPADTTSGVPNDVLTGGTQPGGADLGPSPGDPGTMTDVPPQNFDSNQTPPAYAEPYLDGGGQVFAGAGC